METREEEAADAVEVRDPALAPLVGESRRGATHLASESRVDISVAAGGVSFGEPRRSAAV